jgi:hypothetical protein
VTLKTSMMVMMIQWILRRLGAPEQAVESDDHRQGLRELVTETNITVAQ